MALIYFEISAILAHLIPMMCPLCYICFGFPSPDIWFTPLSIHEGYWNLELQPIQIATKWLKTLFELNSKILCIFGRLPLNTRDPAGFGIAVVINWCFWIAFIAVGVSFASIYLGICMNIETCVESISLTVTNLNGRIARKAKIRKDLKHFIELHIDCYEYDIS